MTTKLRFTLHKYDPFQQELLSLIGEFNGGRATFEFRDLISYIKVLKTKYPLTHRSTFVIVDNIIILHISNDLGATFHTTIELVELQELNVNEIGRLEIGPNGDITPINL